MRPSCAFIFRPLEGVGNAGCPLHPRPRVHFVLVESTRVTTSTPETPGIPARNGFNGFLRALPGDRALLPPSLADYHPQTDASVGGVRTTRLRRPPKRRSSVVPKPSTPSRLNVRDDRETPLERRRDRIAIGLILPGRQAKFGKSEI